MKDFDPSDLQYLTPTEKKELDLLLTMAPPDFLKGTFPEQRAFITDPSRHKGAFCTRRASKSYSIGIHAFKSAWEHPRSSVLITGLTRDETKRIYWDPILFDIAEKCGLTDSSKPDKYCKFNISDLSITLPNRSIIYLLGVDANEKEKRKALGQKWILAVIDEAQSHSQDLEKLVYEILGPAMGDQKGTIILAGTPGDFIQGLFYDLTKGSSAATTRKWKHMHEKHGTEWSFHSWSYEQNPYVAQNICADVANKRLNNPNIDKVPSFQQEYLGIWVTDEEKRIYKYQPGFNDSTYPNLNSGEWYYLLGIDLGWEDATSFVTVAYTDNDPTLYILESKSRSHMTLDHVEAEIKYLTRDKRYDKILIDGSAKQAVESMMSRFNSQGLHIRLTPAEKSEKMEHIALMNSDFLSKRILLCPNTEGLKKEYAELVKDPHSDNLREKPGLANHEADGALYSWRHAYHYRSQVPPKQIPYQSPEWYKVEADKMRELAMNRAERRNQQSFDDPFGGIGSLEGVNDNGY